VAVKKQIREGVGLDNYLLRELAVLKNASHQNLVSYIGAANVLSPNETAGMNALYIVTEFCQVDLDSLTFIILSLLSREEISLDCFSLTMIWVGSFESKLLVKLLLQ
jgi:hypothetical protein